MFLEISEARNSQRRTESTFTFDEHCLVWLTDCEFDFSELVTVNGDPSDSVTCLEEDAAMR